MTTSSIKNKYINSNYQQFLLYAYRHITSMKLNHLEKDLGKRVSKYTSNTSRCYVRKTDNMFCKQRQMVVMYFAFIENDELLFFSLAAGGNYSD